MQETGDSLFRRQKSLFGKKESLFSKEQGIGRKLLNPLSDRPGNPRKEAGIVRTFQKFPAIFPVLSESRNFADQGRTGLRGSIAMPAQQVARIERNPGSPAMLAEASVVLAFNANPDFTSFNPGYQDSHFGNTTASPARAARWRRRATCGYRQRPAASEIRKLRRDRSQANRSRPPS